MPNGQEAFRTLNNCGRFAVVGSYPALGVNCVAPEQWHCDSCVRSQGGQQEKYKQNGRGAEGEDVPQGTIYCLATYCFHNDTSAGPLDVTLTK